MKKKLSTIVLALAMVMCFSVGSFAATSHTVNTDEAYDGSDLSTLVYFTASTAHSNYTVTVPESLIIADSVAPHLYSENAEKGKVSIAGFSTKAVKIVVPNKTIQMTSSDDLQHLNATATFEDLTMAAATATAGSATGQVSVAWADGQKPGIDSWDGSIAYAVSLQ